MTFNRHQETIKQATIKQETIKQETMKQETMKKENNENNNINVLSAENINLEIDKQISYQKIIKEIVYELYDVIGLISVTLNLQDLSHQNYQPWDVVSLSESKIMSYSKTEKEKLIKFSSNSFLRIYPTGTRFDSSNYDPTKAWICGAQLVSLNLQSLLDDYTLLNKLFFKINNANGYILKPSYLRSNSYLNRNYFSPSFTLEIDLLLGFNLQKVMKPNSTEIYATVKVIGTYEDDKNPIFRTESIKDNFFHPRFKNRRIKFSIYEENLSFLLIRIVDKNDQVLARSVVIIWNVLEGYRSIILYDDHCQEIENCILIAKLKKIM